MQEKMYEVIADIGQGSFGKVQKVRRTSDQKVLVWKELNYGVMSEKEKQQIVSEVNILRELNHSNIVKYHDRIIDKQRAKIYIIMEFCDGGDLQQLIRRCRKTQDSIGEDFIWKVLSQTVSALYHCHRRTNTTKINNGIIKSDGSKSGQVEPSQGHDQQSNSATLPQKILHRDLKPGNIFLDLNSDVKLGDFGLARVLNNESQFAFTHVGTPYYMSPEQIHDQKYNEKSDIWSLGCIIYELCALHPPFQALNPMALAMKIKEGKFERIPSRYSEELQRVICWMLNLQQSQRASIDDLINLPLVNVRLREKRFEEKQQYHYQLLKKKEAQIAKREDKIGKKEQQLAEKEQECREFEVMLQQREQDLNDKEKNINQMMEQLEAERRRFDEERSKFEQLKKERSREEDHVDDQSLKFITSATKPIASPDEPRQHFQGQSNNEEDPKRQLQSIGDMSALRNIYNISKNTAGTSSNEEREAGMEMTSNQINVQSLLKFCSGYSIEDQQNLTHDHILKSQNSLNVQKGQDLAGEQQLQDRSLQNLSSSHHMAVQQAANQNGQQLTVPNKQAAACPFTQKQVPQKIFDIAPVSKLQPDQLHHQEAVPKYQDEREQSQTENDRFIEDLYQQQVSHGNSNGSSTQANMVEQQNGLASLREDKTQNILKNYTNLVNRLKQSQREREVDQDKQLDEMPFALGGLPPAHSSNQKEIPKERSEFQQTQQLPFRMSQDPQNQLASNGGAQSNNFLNNTAQSLHQYLKNQPKFDFFEKRDDLNGAAAPQNHKEYQLLGINQNELSSASNRQLHSNQISTLTDRKNNQNMITPLPPRKHDLSNKYTHEINSNLNSLQNSVNYQQSEISTTNGRNNAYLSSGRHPNSNRKDELSSQMRIQSLQDSADPSFQNLPPHPNYTHGSSKGMPQSAAKQGQASLHHSKSQSHFDQDEQHSNNPVGGAANSTMTRMKQCKSATKLLDTLKLRPEGPQKQADNGSKQRREETEPAPQQLNLNLTNLSRMNSNERAANTSMQYLKCGSGAASGNVSHRAPVNNSNRSAGPKGIFNTLQQPSTHSAQKANVGSNNSSHAQREQYYVGQQQLSSRQQVAKRMGNGGPSSGLSTDRGGTVQATNQSLMAQHQQQQKQQMKQQQQPVYHSSQQAVQASILHHRRLSSSRANSNSKAQLPLSSQQFSSNHLSNIPVPQNQAKPMPKRK